MDSDRRRALADEILQALACGEVAHAVDGFAIRHVDDSAVLEVDLNEPDTLYRITVALHARLRRDPDRTS